MYLLISFSISAPPGKVQEIRSALNTCFKGIATSEVFTGCVVSAPSSQGVLNRLIANLISVEHAYDPHFTMAIFVLASGTRWLLTDHTPSAQVAGKIVGRQPELV